MRREIFALSLPGKMILLIEMYWRILFVLEYNEYQIRIRGLTRDCRFVHIVHIFSIHGFTYVVNVCISILKYNYYFLKVDTPTHGTRFWMSATSKLAD